MNEAIVPRRKYNYYGIFSCDSTTKPQKNEDDIGEAKAAYFRAAESMSFSIAFTTDILHRVIIRNAK